MNKRLPVFDSLRGFAMIIMAIYHFCFDLTQVGLLEANMNHEPFWLNFRALIMTLFTGLVGVGLYLSKANYDSKSFRRRLIKIGACALIISVGTYYSSPVDWIYFGILHFVFVVSLLGPLLIKIPRIALPLGTFFIVLPLFYRDLSFNQGFLHLTGLSPLKPMTSDFSPFFPWMGTVFLGIFIGYWVKHQSMKWTQLDIAPLSFLGKHSLVFYMTHQLVLYPIAWVISQI